MEISKELFLQHYIKEMKRAHFQRLKEIIAKEINENK